MFWTIFGILLAAISMLAAARNTGNLVNEYYKHRERQGRRNTLFDDSSSHDDG